MKSRTPRAVYVRNPVYVFYALGAAILFMTSALLAGRTDVGILEQSVFNLFYHLPEFLTPLAKLLYSTGSLVMVLVISLVLLAIKRRDIAVRTMTAAVAAYAIAKITQDMIGQVGPAELIEGVVARLQVSGFSFPSAQAAVSMAAGLAMALYMRHEHRRLVIPSLVAIGCSGLFLGTHTPLDIIGGWTVGIFCYSLVSLALGSVHHPINADKLAKKLQAAGLAGAKLKPAAVDARGSVPFFGEYEGGKIFVKVFNRDNNAADWLFKLVRRVQYRRLEDEVPSLTPKRAIEHEAYLTMLAKHNAGARVPEVLGIYRVGSNSYAMATERIDATGLNKLDTAKLTDKVLDAAWEQIKILHDHRIIHKDLRTANVMIEKNTGLPWIIDFGFSECAVAPRSFYKDNIEFVASSATRIGAKRAVAAGLRALGDLGIAELIPYTQYAALSGATTSDLKQKTGLLDDIRAEMIAVVRKDPDQIKKAKLGRIRGSRHFN